MKKTNNESNIAKYNSVSLPKELPEEFQKQIQSLTSIDKKIKSTTVKAEKAKKSASSAKKQAEYAHSKPAGWFQKQAAIEALQDATMDIALTQSDLADVQNDTLDAMKVSFVYQKELAEMMKYLFALGASNIAANRYVVSELSNLLTGLEGKKFSKDTKEEIKTVIKQLKAQEDVLTKQISLSKQIKETKGKVKDNSEHIMIVESQANETQEQLLAEKDKNDWQDKQISERIKKDIEQDKRLDAGDKKDSEQDMRLDSSVAKDIEHDKRLDEGDKKDLEHDRRLDAGDEKDRIQDTRLEDIDKTTVELENKIIELQKLCDSQQTEIETLKKEKDFIMEVLKDLASKPAAIIAIIIATVALIIGIVNFFI